MNFIKLNINKRFTLKEVSEEYGIDIKELWDFHNSHCTISEFLPLSLPQLIDCIYLPKDIYEKRQTEILPSTTISYPKNSNSKTYGVIIKFEHKDVQIHYKIHVKREHFLVELQKEKSYINNQEVSKVAEQIFEKAEEVLYPLKISVEKNGGFQKIENTKEISQRWTGQYYQKLSEYYVGEVADEILSKINSSFKNLEARSELLSNSIFYQIFFFPVYQTYPNFANNGETNIFFADLEANVSYDIQYLLNREFTRGNKIALKITGLEQEDIFNRNKEKGQLDLLFKFDKENYNLFSITGFVTAFDDKKELKIDFQLYELKNS